ncbi:MAG: cob(I)yrinic acid a,c-diamide adenosyltransferase [Prevotellaceae bacterium]|jgi:cob(I)alamin adenosyltransferase|nr:cob(I)yrinic acid a,c-diamide adenosyltransferase [Prevotellaceae bacterium]
MKIYTKTGDKGQTSLIGGCRVSKADNRLEAYGTVDELNAHLGVLRNCMDEKDLAEKILRIQTFLFDVGAFLATETGKHKLPLVAEKLQEEIQFLEQEIDEMDKNLLPLTKFIIPGGEHNFTVSYIHVCRTVCRRMERSLYRLDVDLQNFEFIYCYVNRLSDYLFVLSRFIAHRVNEKVFFKD